MNKKILWSIFFSLLFIYQLQHFHWYLENNLCANQHIRASQREHKDRLLVRGILVHSKNNRSSLIWYGIHWYGKKT